MSTKGPFKSIAAVTTGLSLSLFASLAAAGGPIDPITQIYSTSVPEPTTLSMMAGSVAVMVVLARLKGKK